MITLADPEKWLIATAAFPMLAAAGVVNADLFRKRHWTLPITQFGLAGGNVCGAILAVILVRGADPDSPIRLTAWNWIALSFPQSPSISFGLEATWVKAGLVSLTGGIALIALLIAGTNKRRPISDDMVVTTSLLYAAGMVFVFAPNLAQALLGWGAVGITAGILIRLSKRDSNPRPNSLGAHSARYSILPPNEFNEGRNNHARRILEYVVTLLERACDQASYFFTGHFPNWLGEQAESLDKSSVSFQMLATVLGASAILLTWLL